jgi:hypothetical protein
LELLHRAVSPIHMLQAWGATTLWKASSVVHVPVGMLAMDRGANPAVAAKIIHVRPVCRINLIDKREIKNMDRIISVWHCWLSLFSLFNFLSLYPFPPLPSLCIQRTEPNLVSIRCTYNFQKFESSRQMWIEWHRCLDTGFPLSRLIAFNCFVRKEDTFWPCLVQRASFSAIWTDWYYSLFTSVCLLPTPCVLIIHDNLPIISDTTNSVVG